MKINSINRLNYYDLKYLTCQECEHTLTCPRFDECGYLLEKGHVNDDSYSKYIDELKAGTSPLPYSKFKIGQRDRCTSSDSNDPMFSYHRSQVNDILRVIRKGGIAYAHTDQILKDVLKFEPTVSVDVQDGTYYIKILNNKEYQNGN